MPDTVTLRDRDGRAYGVPQEQVAGYLAQGFRPESDEEHTERLGSEVQQDLYGGPLGTAEALGTGVLSGLTLGASDLGIEALGGGGALRGLSAQHGIAGGVGQFVGALAPTVLTGGAVAGEEAAGIGARILAHSPAGLAGKVGHAVTGLGEGAGLAGRVAAGTAGAAAEGALYGGGQYLTETALEDKPLSAEGFVAGMGHGALFGAPIGAAGTLASATLQKAASLFPRSEVSAAAAAGVKEQASGALAQTVRDGDAMVQAAERKLSDIDAGVGMAQTGEGATRRVFGAADPQAIADQVTGATARQEVAQALEGYQQARQQFEDWVATEADPELEKALAGLTPGELQTPALAAPRVPIGEFGAPGARGVKSQDTLARIAAGTGRDEVAAAAPADVTGAGGPRALRAQGTPVRSLGEVAPVPVEQSGRSSIDSEIDALRIRADEARRAWNGARNFNRGGLPETPEALAKEAEFNQAERAWREAVERRKIGAAVSVPDAAVEQPVTAAGKRPTAAESAPAEASSAPSGRIEVKDIGGQRMQATMPDGSKVDLGTGGADKFLEQQMPPGFHPAKVATHRDFSIEHGLPKDAAEVAKLDENAIYVAKPSELAERGVWGDPLQEQNVKDVLKRWKDGETLRPVDAYVTPEGRIYIEDGNHRIQAAAQTDRPVAIRFKDGTGYDPHREAHDISGRIRDDLPKGAPVAVESKGAPAADDLLAQLQGTGAKVNEGQTIGQIGAESPARAEYVTARAAKQKSAAEHFRGEAIAKREARAAAVAQGETPNPFHEPAAPHGADLDQFFRDLTAPKTRDAYVAQNIGRAMREEGGSHAAALAKVEREWAERITAELQEERAAVLEYEGGHSRADAERIARDEVANLTRGHGAEPESPGEPVVWEFKKNLRRVEAAKKAADASVERLREIHSAVASNLPQELQTAWKEEGYKFLRDESARIRGMKDRINAASKISEAFTEQYGSGAETVRGYEGDRFHRRAEIEAKHAESWANEQERKYYAALERAKTATNPAERAAAEHESQVIKRQMTQVGARPGAADLPEPLAHLRDVVDSLGKEPAAPASAAEYSAHREAMGLPSATAKAPGTVVDKAMRERMGAVKDERAIAKAIMRHNGKNADMGPRLAREAKVIGDMEAANARLADALGSEAPPTAVTSAKAFHEATAKAQERAAASSAKLGADLQNKVPAMTGGTDATMVDDDVAKALRKHESRMAARGDKTTVSPAPEMPAATPAMPPPAGTPAPAGAGVGGKLADVGSALEVMHAIGMHVPAVSHIPVIGPILGLWLKARAVMGIIGRKGGSIGKSTEGLIASKAAAVQDRIVKATGALLEGGARAAKQASHLAGPAVLLAGELFPGGEKPKSDSPRDLFAARSDDITRAMQPGAIDQAIAQRFPTSDPAMHDAIVAQVQRGIAFLDSKRPKQTVLPGVLPGDGTWKPSAAAIEEFGKYVHAVNDPVSVLEDLAKGHPSAEGAETLRTVYPQLYQYAQKQLLAAAPEMAKTLPYSRRVMLSILYQIPVDGTMQPSHAQFLQTPAPAPSGGKPPNTGPLRLGQQTLSPLDQRAAGA